MEDKQDDRFRGWTVVANISDHLRGGRDPDRFYQGTRFFSPGTKVFVGRAFWGMGGQNIHVMGLRRVSRDFVECVVPIEMLGDLRLKTAYASKRTAQLAERGYVFEEEEKARGYLERVRDAHQYERPKKLADVERSGPWGDWTEDGYRPDLARMRKKPT